MTLQQQCIRINQFEYTVFMILPDYSHKETKKYLLLQPEISVLFRISGENIEGKT